RDPDGVDAVELAIGSKTAEDPVALCEELANLPQLRIGRATHDNLATHAAKARRPHEVELLALGAAPEDDPTLLLPKKLCWLSVVVCAWVVCVCVCFAAVVDVLTVEDALL